MDLTLNAEKLSNIYKIPKDKLFAIIADIFESALDYKYIAFFKDGQLIFFKRDDCSGKIYDIKQLRRYISYAYVRDSVDELIAHRSVREMYMKYIRLKNCNIMGAAVNKTESDYIVLFDGTTGLLPFSKADRNFEFDYGTEYEFNVEKMTIENNKFQIFLSRINCVFVKNIIERELRSIVTVPYREALKISVVYAERIIPEDKKKELRELIGENIIFIDKKTNKVKRIGSVQKEV